MVNSVLEGSRQKRLDDSHFDSGLTTLIKIIVQRRWKRSWLEREGYVELGLDDVSIGLYR